jgi:hypothetical protein
VDLFETRADTHADVVTLDAGVDLGGYLGGWA